MHSYHLEFCSSCVQMTNHTYQIHMVAGFRKRISVCQKCKVEKLADPSEAAGGKGESNG